jgi:hypothetical protein
MALETSFALQGLFVSIDHISDCHILIEQKRSMSVVRCPLSDVRNRGQGSSLRFDELTSSL